jgi:hypothetical protein
MRGFCLLFWLFAACTCSVGQNERDRIRGLIFASPPEIASHALLELLKAGISPDDRSKDEVLREVFQLAGNAQFPYRRRLLPFGLTDTRSGSLRGVYVLNLDAESLRLRAVQLALEDRPALARELFGRLPKQKLGRHDCRDRLVYEPGMYYETMALIADRAFTTLERQRDAHVDFMVSGMQALSSPVEVVPAARALVSVRLDDGQFARVAQAYEGALDNVASDHRGFADGEGLIETADKLAQTYKTHNLRIDRLITVVRDYIVRQLTGVRCPDERSKQARDPASSVVSKFNSWALRLPPHVARETSAIRDADVAAGAVGDAVRDYPYWTSAPAKELLSDVQSLRFKPKMQPVTQEERNSPEWLRRARETIEKVHAWKPAGGDESKQDYFHQKCAIYESLLSLLPSSPERTVLLDHYLGFLASSSIQRDSPAEWLMHAAFFVGEARSQAARDGLQLSGAASAEQNALAALERTGNPVLSLYVYIERLRARKSLAR